MYSDYHPEMLQFNLQSKLNRISISGSEIYIIYDVPNVTLRTEAMGAMGAANERPAMSPLTVTVTLPVDHHPA